MKLLKGLIVLALFLLNYSMLSQTKPAKKMYDGIDERYREDQIYISATFNVLNNLPVGISQSGFSGGVHAGFIRDFPINKKRNWALGLGVGYSLNIYNHNLVVSPNVNGTLDFSVLEDLEIKRNRFHIQLVEVPFQIRWRTSTAESYKFWRVYTGLRGGYVTRFRTDFEAETGERYQFTNPTGINRLRLGATLSIGWNTWNFHVYYSLVDFFKTGTLSDQDRKNMSTIKLGLEFFIL